MYVMKQNAFDAANPTPPPSPWFAHHRDTPCLKHDPWHARSLTLLSSKKILDVQNPFLSLTTRPLGLKSPNPTLSNHLDPLHLVTACMQAVSS